LSGVLYPLIALMKIMLWISYVPYYVEKRRYLFVVFNAVKDGLFNNLSRSHREILQICGTE
jgi:hypothetical protein